MKKAILVLFMFFMTFCHVFAKELIAILPFTGGQGNEGETIAELFSFDESLNDVFGRIPRTTINNAVTRERRFQMDSGMTDIDTMVSISNELGARYVVAGNISLVGNNKLLVISIIDIYNLQQIAGDYIVYNNIGDIPRRLSNMAKNIILATRNNTSRLPRLSIVPLQLQDGADQYIADTLAQILAINLIRSGKYSIYPRTRSLEQVRHEHNIQMRGHTGDTHVVGIGHGHNPELVLSVVARRLGNINMFNAEIINLFTGMGEGSGRSVEYQTINDGIRIMEVLATDLVSTADQVNRRRFWSDRTRFWSIGGSIGTSFADPWFVGTIRGTIAPFRYSFLELGLDLGFVSTIKQANYYTLCPFVHYAFFLPFNNFGWYIGAGGSYTTGEYKLPERTIPVDIFAIDFITGFTIKNIFDISYTLRTNFSTASSKISVGASYRFK